MKLLLATTLFTLLQAKTYFKETFDTDEWSKVWVPSTFKEDYGKFVVSPGKFYADKVTSRGLQTSQDARFYAISAPFSSPFKNKGKDFVVQFSVKHEQSIDCGGGYVKIFPSTADLKKLNGDTKYNIMFGPDICGGDRKVHVIINYKDDNHLIKTPITPETDQLTHLYTFILKPDQTYQVLIDDVEKASGSILKDWDLLPPKEIQDPKESKPADWVDEPMMDDSEDKKPEGYDDIPATIPDTEAKKPEDWDDDMDGEWEAPKMANPDYQGEWKPRQIKNPKYKGPWEHPKIPNPEYKEDKEIYAFESGAIAFDLWQVKSGTIFDDVIVTDSVEEAKAFAKETYFKKKDLEKDAKKKLDDAEQKKAEEEMKKNEEKEKEAKEGAKKGSEEEKKSDETSEDGEEHEEL